MEILSGSAHRHQNVCCYLYSLFFKVTKVEPKVFIQYLSKKTEGCTVCIKNTDAQGYRRSGSRLCG